MFWLGFAAGVGVVAVFGCLVVLAVRGINRHASVD